MAFINKEGKRISYDSSELIRDLSEDIIEFGNETVLYAKTKEMEGVNVYVDYAFEPEEGYDIRITATALLELLNVQNEI